AEGVFQFVDEAGHFDAQVTNYAGGIIHAGAFAQATDAGARAHAAGVSQYAIEVASANLTTINQGVIAASAYAAVHGGQSEATAVAYGVDQLFVEVFNPNATVHNSNLIVANAQAFAPSGEAFADAAGIRIVNIASQYGFEGGQLHLDVQNSGNILALAKAQGEDAFAEATGIFVFSSFSQDGQILNSGKDYASAFANGTEVEQAHAVGIWDPSQIDKTTIENTGLINAYAQISGKATAVQIAAATGILISATEDGSRGPILGLPGGPVDPTAKATIINDGGTIWAGFSLDGGKTINRGNAINLAGLELLNEDVLPAPNPVEIDLKGTNHPGHIHGDIVLDQHDVVNVTNGKTFFDGVLFSPHDFEVFVADDVLPFNFGQDNHLNIDQGGNLVLCQEGWTNACDPSDWSGA